MDKYKNFLIILSSPSGNGKSTLTNMLLEKYNNIKLAVSATTRQPREGEKNGVHYYFLNQEDFDKKVANNEFLEYAGVYGKSYGTLKSEVDNKLSQGQDVLLDIDWQGNLSVSKQITDKTKLITIFLLPPSIQELRNRLIGRGTDSQEIIDKRMKEAKEIITHYHEYDYVIVNDNLNIAFEQLCAIIENKRLQNRNENDIKNFVNKLLEE